MSRFRIFTCLEPYTCSAVVAEIGLHEWKRDQFCCCQAHQMEQVLVAVGQFSMGMIMHGNERQIDIEKGHHISS